MGREERVRDESPVSQLSPGADAPAPVVAAATPMPNLSAEQFAALVGSAVAAAVTSNTQGAADIHAEAMKRALKPENAFPPGVSVFNPEGERDHPKPKLKCKFTMFDGVPIDGDTDTKEEMALYNQLEAGKYLVDRSDGSKMPFVVKEFKNDYGQLQRIDVSFPYRDEADRAAVLPMRVWLADVVAQQAARHA